MGRPQESGERERDRPGGQVADWSPRSTLDRALVFAYSTVSRIGLVALALGLLAWQLTVATDALAVRDPLVLAAVLVSALPALGLAAYIWYADVAAQLRPGLLTVTFLLGVAFVGLAGALNAALGDELVSIAEGTALTPPVVLSLVFVLVVAPVEEGVKLLAVHLYAYRSARFGSVLSGAVYGAAAGLGFATMENAFYITEQLTDAGSLAVTSDGGAVATVRAFVGPGHVVYSAFAGYYLGLARFNRRYAGVLVLKGFLLAVGLHATYNVLVSADALSVPEHIADALGLSEISGFFTFALAYNGVLIALLIYVLSQYRAAYEVAHEESVPESERTEFERGVDSDTE